MFKYRIPGTDAGTAVTRQFTGLDRRACIADGACREMRNLTTDDYPCLSVRPGRTRIAEYQDAVLLLHKDGKPFVVDGTSLRYDGQAVGSVAAGRKRAVRMNDWIFLWPDKKAFHAADGELRDMEEHTGALRVGFTHSSITRRDGQGWPFRVGDGVTIEGCTQGYNNRTAVVQAVDGSTLTFYDNVFQYGEPGSAENQSTHSWNENAASFSRTVPDLDFVCEKDNRLWGVYGNHICCCKLGDGFNWNVFHGLASDAYDVGVGSDGSFTGIIGFSSYVLAFKEGCVHKLYGTKPTNFTVYTSYIPGVQTDCADTLQVWNNRLFYLSREGVMSYGGGTPEPVGMPLCRAYERAAAGVYGAKYYLSGVSAEGAEIVVYDMERGLWSREDETEAVCFSAGAGALCLLDADGAVWQYGTGGPVEWEAVFGPFETSGIRKSSRLSLTLTGEPGAVLAIDTRTDGRGWRQVWGGQAKRPDGRIRVPFLPVRGRGFSIRLRGKGKMTLHALTRWMREGCPK